MIMCILQWSAVITAGLAAVFWIISATIKTPSSFSIHVVKPNQKPLGEPLGGTYMGNAYSEDLKKLAKALRTQSKWSAAAAICAALSAVSQGILVTMT